MELGPGYHEYAPPAALRPHVVCLWSRLAASGSTLVLPDGCVDLMWTSATGPFFAGPDTHATLYAPDDSAAIVGVRFAPGSGAAIGLPLIEVQNARVGLRELWSERRGAAWLADLVGCEEATDAAGALRALVRLTGALLRGAETPDAVAEAVRRLRRPEQRVSELAGDLGMSQRQLHRLFVTHVGYAPKTLQRVVRFQGFLARGRSGVSLAEAAWASGYADQPHLTRDCVELSGRTPAQLLAQ
jgi:AraC-like DNA-binding protein